MTSEPEWVRLPATEREAYVAFHEAAAAEDLRHAEDVALDYPRWSVISGYYSMHDLAKLLLARRFGVKLASPHIHRKAIAALEHFVQDEQVRTELLALLSAAKEAYDSAERLRERLLPALLRRGREERGRAQYYNEGEQGVDARKSAYFLDTVVRPFEALVRGLLDAP